MTIIEDRPVTRRNRAARADFRRPSPARPAVRPMAYRGRGIPVSTAAHGPRPVSTRVTIALAALAALITLWLGSLAELGAGGQAAAPAQLPERLAVVVVQAGENLHQLAARIAPDAPAAEVVARIRGLNGLESSAVGAGQTLIAPVG